MQKKIEQIKDIFINKQFIIFIMIGCINTLSTTVFSSLYTRLLGSIQSFVLGYLTGILISYTLNTIFTFHEGFSGQRLIQFTVSTIPNFIIQLIIVYLGVTLMQLPNIICYGVAALIGVPITFLILKLYVFIKR